MKLYFAWFLALVGTLGSLYMSEIAAFPPCDMCWYQRICLFPLAVILGISVWKGNAEVVSYILFLPIVGGIVAFCQILMQEFSFFASLPLCGAGHDCHTPALRLFGFFTIPMMSLAAFIAITVLLRLAQKQK